MYICFAVIPSDDIYFAVPSPCGSSLVRWSPVDLTGWCFSCWNLNEWNRLEVVLILFYNLVPSGAQSRRAIFSFFPRMSHLILTPGSVTLKYPNILDILISPVVDPFRVRDYAERTVKRRI